MVAIAIGLLWAGYTGGLWGYCLLRGYDVTFQQLLSRTWPPNSQPESGFGPGGSSGGGAGGGGGGSWGMTPPKTYRPPGSK